MSNFMDLIRALKAALAGNVSAVDGIETTIDVAVNGSTSLDGLLAKLDDVNEELEAIDTALQG